MKSLLLKKEISFLGNVSKKFFYQRRIVLIAGFLFIALLIILLAYVVKNQDIQWNFYAELFGIAVTILGLDFIFFYDRLRRNQGRIEIAAQTVNKTVVDLGLAAFSQLKQVFGELDIPYNIFKFRSDQMESQVPLQELFDWSVEERTRCYNEARRMLLQQLRSLRQLDTLDIRTGNMPQALFDFIRAAEPYYDSIENLRIKFDTLLTPSAAEKLLRLEEALCSLRWPLRSFEIDQGTDTERNFREQMAKGLYQNHVICYPNRFRQALVELHHSLVELLQLIENEGLVELN